MMNAEKGSLITASASDLCLWLFSFSKYLIIWVIFSVFELKQQKSNLYPETSKDFEFLYRSCTAMMQVVTKM